MAKTMNDLMNALIEQVEELKESIIEAGEDLEDKTHYINELEQRVAQLEGEGDDDA